MPGVLGNSMWLQGCMEQGTSWFDALTRGTSFDILSYVTTHARPVVIPRYQLQRLVMSRMPGDSSIMMQSDDVSTQSAILWNIDMSLECNDVLMIHPVIRVSEKTLDCSIVLNVVHLPYLIDDWGRQCLHCYRWEEVSVQDCDIFVIIRSSTVLFQPRKDVCLVHAAARPMDHGEVVRL